jgi:hypothetical protein
MIFAFMAYKASFTEKAATLVEKALDFRLLDLHLERISEFALAGTVRPNLPRPYGRRCRGYIAPKPYASFGPKRINVMAL